MYFHEIEGDSVYNYSGPQIDSGTSSASDAKAVRRFVHQCIRLFQVGGPALVAQQPGLPAAGIAASSGSLSLTHAIRL